jgi:FkbM family methyltransferase
VLGACRPRSASWMGRVEGAAAAAFILPVLTPSEPSRLDRGCLPGVPFYVAHTRSTTAHGSCVLPAVTRSRGRVGCLSSAPCRQSARRLLRRVGLDVLKAGNVPFGMRWEDDIAALGTVKLAVDVGANEGQTADLLGRAFPAAQIFSYEPVPSTFNVLQRRYAGSRHVTCIRAAVGATSGSAKIVSGAISSQNTLLTHAKPDQPTVLVPMTTIALQADAYGWDHIDLLKSDTEGYELPVLEGALPLLEQARIRFILAECDFMTRPTDPHTYFPDLLAMLSPLGYRVVAFYTAGVDGQGWVWGNVLFMKGSARRDVLLTPRAVPH